MGKAERVQFTLTKAALQVRGITLTYKAETEEFRVNYTGKSERYAYYSNDFEDARATALHMAANRPAELKDDLRVGRAL